MRGINLKYVEEKYDENGVLSYFKAKYPDNFNFAYDTVDDIAVNDPDRMAMVWCNPEGDERFFTFADMKKYSDKAANYLKSLGIKKGDMVLVALKRHYQFWFIATAIHKLGAVMVPATFMLTAHDAEYRVNAAGISCVICTALGDTTAAFDQVESLCPTMKTKVVVNGQRDGWHDFDAGMEQASEEWERVETHVSEPLLMYFSSGTSGYPKMVLHDHTYALAHIFTAKHWHNVDPEGIHFTIADTGWGKAVWGKYYGQWTMETCVFTYDFDRFVSSEILSLISKYKITSLCCPPTMYRFLLLEGIENYDMSSLKYVTAAGEPLNPDVFFNWKKATGLEIMEGFGQTETTVTICTLPGMTPKPGSMGKPSPQYKVELHNEKGEICPPGVTGEVVMACRPEHPDGLMLCYYLNKEKTDEAIHDGYYHTGDTAWMDEEGYLWFVGRNDDIIKSSGYRIGPFEIESVLAEHPAVLECAVTGVPDEIRGQIIKATVVLSDGYIPDDTLKKELQSYVKKQTAPYKYPRIIDFVPELPKTINGKIRRVVIRNADVSRT